MRAMSTHSVAEAKNRLSELIDRALNGEEVVITRHGRPVVAIRAVREVPHPVSAAELDWLAERRVGLVPAGEDAGMLLTKLRDEQER
jgi:prevent-host-death family protein